MNQNRTKEFLLKNSKLLAFLSLFVIAIIIPFTIYTAQQRQNTNSKAFQANSIASMTEAKLYKVPTKLALGNRVQTVKKIHVWSGSSIRSNASGTQKNGSQGVIIDGPIQVFGSWWWKVDFDIDPDGWTNEDFLKKLGGDNPSPIPSPSQPYSLEAPIIIDLEPVNNSNVLLNPSVTVKGKVMDSVSPSSQLGMAISNQNVQLSADGSFQKQLALKKGANIFTLKSSGPNKNPRQQINDITAYLDGSVVYGSDPARAAALRTMSGGKLKTSQGNLPPYNTMGLPNANDAHIFPNEKLFIGGDVRANENVELTAVHTLFIREHNLLADAIAKKNPKLSDEEIYQRARQIVTAEIQVITYKEFIPALLGPTALKPYRGYNPNVNPGISNEFSTAAFRIGHTLINDDVEFLDNEGEEVRDELELAEAFFNPSALIEVGPDPILKYLATDNAQEVDTKLVKGLRDFLFGPPGAGGLDLASLNIQRGRDHGLADYNATRKAYGLSPVTSFSQIASNAELQQKLQTLYGDVNNIDLWVAGLAEDHVPDASVGQTFQRIMGDQFERTRDGDRFWYQLIFKGRQLSAIESTKLSDVIKRNTTITKLQDNVFFFDGDRTLASLTPKKGSIPDGLIEVSNNNTVGTSIDGYGNNIKYPRMGQAGVDLLRMTPVGYVDGIAAPAGSSRPSPRLISNTVASQSAEEMGEDALRNRRNISDWIYGWGQFLDHDLDLTTGTSESFNIAVPKGDVSFDPESSGNQIIPLRRSRYDITTGTGTTKIREQEYTLSLLTFGLGKKVIGKGSYNVRANPTSQSQQLYVQKDKSEGVIIGGPVEAEGQRWWRIFTNGQSGWIPETYLNQTQ